jgi:hypothetical protein
MGPKGCPKRRYLTTNLRCVTSHKNEDSIYTAAEARNHVKKLHCLKYETVTLVGIQTVAFEVIAPCSMSGGHHCFKKIGCFHVHCRGLCVLYAGPIRDTIRISVFGCWSCNGSAAHPQNTQQHTSIKSNRNLVN